MFFTRGNMEWLEKTIGRVVDEKIRAALTVPVRMERMRDMATGQPLAVPQIEVRDVYLPDHWVEYLPYAEGALRGVQGTMDTIKNDIAGSLGALPGLMMALAKKMAETRILSDHNDKSGEGDAHEDK